MGAVPGGFCLQPLPGHTPCSLLAFLLIPLLAQYGSAVAETTAPIAQVDQEHGPKTTSLC